MYSSCERSSAAAIASAVILGRNQVIGRLHGRTARVVSSVLEFGASGAIIIVGTAMFVATI
jgi:hypothetical protein